MKHSRLLFIGTFADKPYLQRLKPCIGMASCALLLETPTTFAELVAICKSKNATGIITTSSALLQRLVDSTTSRKVKPSIDNYAGSLFKIPGNSELELVVVHPLEQLISVPYGQFLATRYISKLVNPDAWVPSTKFNWEIFSEATYQEIYSRYQTAEAIAIDIETFQSPPSIRCIGYTALFYSAESGWSSHSYVIPCDSLFNLACIRQLNDIACPKIFQNGKYDIAYLQSYNAAPINYLWDTAELFHSWYSELPKDLACLNSFFVRDSMYWKDLADTSDLKQYYLYNAKDTWATANVFLAWMAEAPQWARHNYANTFPLQFACHLSEMTGVARDMQELQKVNAEQQELIATHSAALDTMLDVKGFNVNSPIQMKALLKILGCHDLESADEKNLKKAALRHPLNARIIEHILEIRGARKLVSTYITAGKEFHGHLGQYKEIKRGRILYSLNPHGTDTGRLASREHHFWCGLQIQNIPRGTAVKRTLIADDGFIIGECDLEQAESRDTAHIAGDEALIKATGGSKDFHSVNASAFFGLPYSSIYSDELKKTINKAIRDLAKRVNHGANYNMGPDVLVDTMGSVAVREAQRLLGLPKFWSLRQVAEHLLAAFHKTYPAISKTYYPGVIAEILTTRMLSSKAVHHVDYQASKQGLVRYCFGNPEKNKRHLNAYVAHPPQSLNAMTLNRAYMKVFYELAIHPDHRFNFKLLAQIHDSILFQFRKGHEYLADAVKRCMEIPVSVTGYDGSDRTFTVPAATKTGKNNDSIRWSTTE
jgi:DNA polymerase I-like protein with 3'-5' exonuclease and polymerase domains